MCHVLRQVNVGFADKLRSYTRSLEHYILELSRHMTIQDVANHLNVSWDVIKDIQKRNLKKRYKSLKLKRIAIDEITIGKGDRYLTIVLDIFISCDLNICVKFLESPIIVNSYYVIQDEIRNSFFWFIQPRASINQHRGSSSV